MMTGDRREHPRADFPVLVLFRFDPSGPFEPAYGADVSTGGLSIRGGRAEVGAIVDLQLVEPLGRRPLEVLGEVLRVDDAGFTVRFSDLDPGQREWLEDVVRRRSAASRVDADVESLLPPPFDER